MPQDDILAEVGADWKRQTVDHERLRVRVASRQRRTRLHLAVKIAGTVFAMFAGCWFVFLGMTEGVLALGFAGAILLAAFPLMVLEVRATRRLTQIGVANSPEGALRAARDQAVASLRLLWAPRAVAIVMGVSTAGLAALHFLSSASLTEAGFAVPVWLVTAVIVWIWQARRARRLRAEISRCEQLLREMRRV